jgi:hypothetical protein
MAFVILSFLLLLVGAILQEQQSQAST